MTDKTFEIAFKIHPDKVSVRIMDEIASEINYNLFMTLKSWSLYVEEHTNLIVYKFRAHDEISPEDESSFKEFISPLIIKQLGEAYDKCSTDKQFSTNS